MTNNPTRICAVVCEPRSEDVARAIARAADDADLVEVRLDCIEDISISELQDLCLRAIHSSSKPLIITLRAADEGGRQGIPGSVRLEFWRSAIAALMSNNQTLVDIEYDLVRELQSEQGFRATVDWQRVICSVHDFDGMPADVDQVYRELAETPAGILKIAVTAEDATDAIPMFRILDGARQNGREIIPIAMGEAGVITRILGPSRGAFLTYALVEADRSTAPGQITCKDLVELYRVRHINPETQIFALIGDPVSHSVSPHMHNAAFAHQDVDAVYLPLQVKDAGAFLRRMVKPSSREIDLNWRGLSVTAPHKIKVLDHLDWICARDAQSIGAVNTIIVEDGELRGFNTDWVGIRGPLQRTLVSLVNTRCAIIGAGGAARTAAWTLLKAGARVSIFARTVANAKSLADEFSDEFNIECKPLSAASFADYEIVINATPLGTRGRLENETVANAEQLRGVRLVFDLVYNSLETRFMKEAKQAGCDRIGGLEMLVEQGAAQFNLWIPATAPVEAMRDAARRALEQS